MAIDWKDTLSKIAPTAATLLGGPFAGLAVQLVGQALGTPDATVKTIQQTLTTGQLSGDQIIALKKAELDMQARLEDNGITLEQIAAADRDSARKREETVKDYTPAILAFVVTLGFFGLLMFMVLHGVQDGSREIINVMVGSLSTAWIGIISYYFGSSRGSDRKTEIMAQQSTN